MRLTQAGPLKSEHRYEGDVVTGFPSFFGHSAFRLSYLMVKIA